MENLAVSERPARTNNTESVPGDSAMHVHLEAGCFMLNEELSKLILDIHNLPSKDQLRIRQIIQLSEPTLRIANPNDMTIDFKLLKLTTFRELQSYVASCLPGQPRKVSENSGRKSKQNQIKYQGLKIWKELKELIGETRPHLSHSFNWGNQSSEENLN